jgi:para-nitrobenzyl esterase
VAAPGGETRTVMTTWKGIVMKTLAIIVVAIAVLWVAQLVSAQSTVVNVEGGSVQGVATTEVTSWKGIPYVVPPVGDLRWRTPQPVKPWQGVRDASTFGAECMQSDDVLKSEDCLFLNVWRPAGIAGPLPVMVWIYGGELVHGQTPLYPADGLAKQGVVVSMNYRMGRLGFFAHPALAAEAPAEVRGNYGYPDQRAALQWVQRNIAAEGGDPTNVTMFGEFAGGGSVLVHLTSPLWRGLFHRVIVESPGIPTPRAKVTPLTELADAEKRAVEYARSPGVTAEGPAALKALRALPATKFLEGASTQEVIGAITSEASVIGVSGSIVDGTLVVEAPEKALAAGHQAMVPLIIAANDRDLGAGTAKSTDELFAVFGPAAAEARKGYDPLGDQTLAELKQQVDADKTMCEPGRHLANEMARAGQPVWLYRFSSVAESQRGQLKGTLHGFEIPYMFNIPAALVGEKVTCDDKVMGALASAYWVSVARTGDPNGGGRLLWPCHDPAVDRIMHFTNSGVIVGTDPLKQRLDPWQRVWS